MSYIDYLKSDHWQQFKQAFREKHPKARCRLCKSKLYDLHHVTYQRIGAERFDDVTTLCRSHHDLVHEWLRVRKLPVESTEHAIQWIAGDCTPYDNRRSKAERKAKKKAEQIPTPLRYCPCGNMAKKGKYLCRLCQRGEKLRTLKPVKKHRSVYSPSGFELEVRQLVRGLRTQSPQ